MEIQSRPTLATIGGSTQVGGGPGGFYTQDEYRDIVAHAASRFITIVPEIDMPGHTNAALASIPELNCDGVEGGRLLCGVTGFTGSQRLSVARGTDVTGGRRGRPSGSFGGSPQDSHDRDSTSATRLDDSDFMAPS